ncbi:hypothetical protein V5028_24070 [Enterobacter hormaechei]|uniref:hypothetical protein n=1 Tax=Enterobacter hormaechei TaxID=158836 RepID=UPI00307671A3
MSNKYEDLIKNARMNADCGEHMSPAEVTTLLNVVETTFAALAGEVYDLKHPGTYLPSKRETPATDAFLVEVRELAKAEGVQEYADSLRHSASKIRECYGDNIRVRALLHEASNADKFAAQLRKGVQS